MSVFQFLFFIFFSMRSILRQFVAVFALAGLAFGLVPSVSAATFTQTAAAEMLSSGGYIGTNYRYADTLTRQENVGIAVKVKGILALDAPSATSSDCEGNPFADVSEAWVCRATSLAAAAGIITTANTNFRPHDNVSSYEALVMALKSSCINPTDAASGSTHVAQTAQRGVEAGAIDSAAGFNANAAATRGQAFVYFAAAVAYAEAHPEEMDSSLPGCEGAGSGDICADLGTDSPLYALLCTMEDDMDGDGVVDSEDACPDEYGMGADGCPVDEVVTGNVTLSVSATQPTGTLVACQAGANLFNIDVEGSGTLSSLTLNRTGYSSNSDLSNVYLYDGNTRLTSGYSFNTNGVITMNNLNIVVDGSTTLSVRADVACTTTGGGVTSGNTIGVSVSSATLAGGSATPVVLIGNVFPIANVGLASVTMPTSNVANPANASVTAGTTATTLWSHTVNVSTRSVNLDGILARMIGSAPVDALSNVSLVVDGTVVATATPNAGGYMYFAPTSAVSLSTGSHTLEVRANIVSGSNRNFYIVVENASDFMFEDSNYAGVYVLPVISGTTPVSNVLGGTMTINAGTLTVSAVPTTTTSIVGGSTNTTVGTFKFQAYGEDVKVSNLSVQLNGSITAGLRNVSLYVNGAQIGSSVNLAAGALPQTVAFSSLGSNLIVPVGTPVTVEVKADIVDATGIAYTSGTLSAGLLAGSNNAQGQSSMALSSTSAATAQTYSINSSNAVFAKSSGFVSQSVAPNSTQVKIGSFVLQAGNAEGLTVNNLAVTLTPTTFAITNVSNLTVKEGSTTLGTPIGVPAAGVNNFSISGITVPTSGSKTFDIYADLGSATVGTVQADASVTYRGNVSNLSTTSSTVTGVVTTVGTATLVANLVTPTTEEVAQYVVGADTQRIVTYRFKSSNNIPATITRLRFTVPANDSIQSVEVNGVTATVASGIADVSGLSIAVPGNSVGVSIPVKVTYSCFVGGNVGVGCNLSSPAVTSPVSTSIQIAALTDVEAISGGSIINLTGTLPLTSQTMSLVASIPTVTSPSTSLAGLVASPAGSRTVKIGEVSIAADAGGAIYVDQIAWNVGTAGGAVVLSAELREGSTVVTGASCTAAGVCTLTSPITVDAGTTRTFALYAEVSPVSGAANTVSVSTALDQATFLWQDAVGNSGSLAGTGLVGFSTNSYSIHN